MALLPRKLVLRKSSSKDQVAQKFLQDLLSFKNVIMLGIISRRDYTRYVYDLRIQMEEGRINTNGKEFISLCDSDKQAYYLFLVDLSMKKEYWIFDPEKHIIYDLTQSEKIQKPLARELITQVNALWKYMSASNNFEIQRDLNDEPGEPLTFKILGASYDYKSAELALNPETEVDEMIVTLLRFEDAVIGSDKLYTFPMTLQSFEEYHDSLVQYIRDCEDRANES